MVVKRVDLVKLGGFAAEEHLQTVDIERPTPGENEVLIDIQASAINPVDWKMAEMGFLLPDALPATLGCDVAGVIVEVGASVDSLNVGKSVVTYLGADKTNTKTSRPAFASLTCADADLVFDVPEGMTLTQACSLPVGALTAKIMLDAIQNGSSSAENEFVLVWGASSSVGFNAVQLALKQGYQVIAVASSKHKELLETLGVQHFVDYRKDDVNAMVTGIVKDGGKPLNGALDCIGNDSFTISASLLADLGTSDKKTVSSVAPPMYLSDPPEGVSRACVDLGTVLNDKSEKRQWVVDNFPQILSLKTQSLKIVSGPVSAETVQKAFQMNKDGVSGEKVVIEWKK